MAFAAQPHYDDASSTRHSQTHTPISHKVNWRDSVPTPNPMLAAHESVQCGPEQPPALSQAYKSVEIDHDSHSNASTPEPIPTAHSIYDNHYMPRQDSTQAFPASPSQGYQHSASSEKEDYDDDEDDDDEDDADMQQRLDRSMLPITMNMGAQPMMPASGKPMLSNAASVAKTKVSLDRDFSNDKPAYLLWKECCDIQDETFGYYSAMYPLLCEMFAERTQCSRVPKQSDLEEVVLKHGGTRTTLSALHNEQQLSGVLASDKLQLASINQTVTPPDTPPQQNSTQLAVNDGSHMAMVSTGSESLNFNKLERAGRGRAYSDSISFDFDNPNQEPAYLVTIQYKAFFKFWKWFKECCLVIRELARLWDANAHSVVQCNLFCGREESQRILEQAPQGTFMLRLSSVIKGGVVLSYCEPSMAAKAKRFKHTILIRREEGEYELRKKKKKKAAAQQNGKRTTIAALVRSFTKIKFLYTPNHLYPKKSVF